MTTITREATILDVIIAFGALAILICIAVGVIS